MNKSVSYRQCTMRRPTGEGSVTTTSYIPMQYAKLGRVLKLRGDDDAWVDGWVVESVGEGVLKASDLPDFRKAIRNHRKSTGDSDRRPKNKKEAK